MKKTAFTKALSCILCIVLIAATALVTTSCSTATKGKSKSKDETPATFAAPEDPSESDDESEIPSGHGDFDDNIIGKGAKDFKFSATDIEGNVLRYHIYTDAQTVGEALIENRLIEGDEGQYGIYVKKVCGVVADYDIDQTYWMFCIEGEMAPSGVDATEIVNGTTYNFIVSK